MKRPFFTASIIGALVMIVSLILMTVNPKKGGHLPEGFSTPIIAFEFSKTADDINGIFDSTEREEIANSFDLGNKIDIGYMALYSLFLSIFSYAIFKRSRNKFYLCLSFFPALILLADFAENMALFNITANLAGGSYSKALSLLPVFTWIKWGGMTVFFAAAAVHLLKGRGIFAKVIAFFTLLTVLLALASFVQRSAVNELFALGIALLFTFTIIYSWLCRKEELS